MQPTSPLFRRLRRLALTTKMVNSGFYKGTGSGSMGRHTKHGGYVIDRRKVRTYVVPEGLQNFKVGLVAILLSATPVERNVSLQGVLLTGSLSKRS